MIRRRASRTAAGRRSLLADVRALTPSERRLWRSPLMWAGALAVLFIPLLYAGVYLASVWDPYGQLDRLPVAFVNADAGTRVDGRSHHLGRDLASTLRDDPPVRLVTYPTEAAARAAVRRGDVYFALTVPEDFSRRALAGRSSEHGLLRLYTAPGTSYFASRVGRSVAGRLADQLNAELGSHRWAAVQHSLTAAQRDLGKLRAAARQLADGAGTLEESSGTLQQGAGCLAGGVARAADGSAQLAAGAREFSGEVGHLTGGVTRLSSGLRQLEAAAPGQAQLEPLLTGAGQLTQGAAGLTRGLDALAQGAEQLATGSAADPLTTGTTALAGQAAAARTGAQHLAAGAADLQQGVERTVQGTLRVKEGLGSVTRELPAARDLDRLRGGARTLAQRSGDLADGVGELRDGARQLASGVGDLHAGAARLHRGLGELVQKVPDRAEPLGGDPQGLSASVQVVEEHVADVPNNGSAFAPYFITLALWVGGTLTTFLFPYLLLPESGRHTGQLARVLRKVAVPGLYVVGQALITVLGLRLLGVPFEHPGLVVLTAALASLTFLLLILALNLLLGAAGRLLALVLLVVQLAASGGSYPVELSSGFFQRVHAILPVTDAVNALRSALFGAYQGQYGVFLGRLLLVALLSFGVALLSRRQWKFAPDAAFRSPLVTDVG